MVESFLYEKLATLLEDPSSPILPPPFSEREIPSYTGGIISRITVFPEAQERLYRRNAWLDDNAINSLSQLLHLRVQQQTFFLNNARACAVFSSHMFALAAKNVSSRTLYRNCRYTRYWKRDVWILPIHQPDALHWRLAVVAHARATIFIYDSQGISPDARNWAEDLKVCWRRIHP
jgi:Ulp1 family protease